jgi:hypothetical protein
MTILGEPIAGFDDVASRCPMERDAALVFPPRYSRRGNFSTKS